MPSDMDPTVVVAGHTCLDVIPGFGEGPKNLDELLVPGRLVEVGSLVTSPGGVVSNTGLALHRLGISTRLVGKIGDDLFGRAILERLRDCHASLADAMIVAAGEATSYTLVLNPPGVDRLFLHCPGVNDTFRPDEIPLDHLTGARLLHFGYPPLMRQTYADGGAGLADFFREVRARGVVVSLDMAWPDRHAESGRVDWSAWMRRVLPNVDLFGPSVDELLFMLDRPGYDDLAARFSPDHLLEQVGGVLLHELSSRLLDMGPSVVLLKLGEHGLYLRTSERSSAFGMLASGGDEYSWFGRELLHASFAVDAAGTTGAGDAALAGFLTALVLGLAPEEGLEFAAAVGACSVEGTDATSGILSWSGVRQRIRSGWPRRRTTLDLPGWQVDERGLWRSALDTIGV